MSDVEEILKKFDELATRVTADISRLTSAIHDTEAGLAKRIGDIETQVHARLQSFETATGNAEFRPSADTPGDPAFSPTTPTQQGAAEDSEALYSVVRDAVSKITLTKDFEVCALKKNIKRQDHLAVDVIGKCGGYSATILKVLSAFNPGMDSMDEFVNYMYHIAIAQTRYLQSKYASMSIKGSFDEQTSRMFDMLDNNALRLNDQSYRHLETAARLASIRPPQPIQQGRQQGNYNRPFIRNNHNQKQDVFSGFAHKQFPPKKPYQQNSQKFENPSSDGTNKD